MNENKYIYFNPKKQKLINNFHSYMFIFFFFN